MEELCTPRLLKGRQHYPLSNALARSGKTAAFEGGPRAHALRQASVRHRLFSMFAQQWHDVPAFVAMADRGLAEEEAIDNTMPVHAVISSCYLRFAECFNCVLMRDLTGIGGGFAKGLENVHIPHAWALLRIYRRKRC